MTTTLMTFVSDLCRKTLPPVLVASMVLAWPALAQEKKRLEDVSEEVSTQQEAAGGSEIPLEEKDLDTPEKMVAEIDRLAGIINEYLLSIGGDDARMLGPGDMEDNDPFPQRQELIWMLYETDPDHPRLNDLMHDRWRAMSSMRTSRPLVIGEALKVMKNDEAGEDLLATALYWHTFSSMRARLSSPLSTPERLEEQANKFILKYPDDPRGANLLGFIARGIARDPEKRLEIFRRLGEEYPDTFMGRIGAGRVRQKEALGKPFELEFEDFRSGDKISTADLSGNIIVIDFFATFCKPCKDELRDYVKLAETYGPKGVTFLVISLDRLEERGGKEALSAFLEEVELDWPVYYQGKGFQSDFSQDWGIDSLPATFVVDQQGILRTTNPGNQLEEILDALLEREDGKEKN